MWNNGVTIKRRNSFQIIIYIIEALILSETSGLVETASTFGGRSFGLRKIRRDYLRGREITYGEAIQSLQKSEILFVFWPYKRGWEDSIEKKPGETTG